MSGHSQNKHHFDIDVRWCVEALRLDDLISEKEANLILTTPRTRNQQHLHPLEFIAEFGLKNSKNPEQTLSLPVLSQWLAHKSGLELYRIDPLKINVPQVTAVVSFEFSEKNHILVVEVKDDTIIVGTDQPYDFSWVDNIEPIVRPKKIERVFISPDSLKRYQSEFYHVTKAIAGARKTSNEQARSVEAMLQLGEIHNPDANDHHIVRIVDWLLQYAFEQRASDIHLEMRKDLSRVRFRIDGVLHTVYEMPSNIMLAVISRIKNLGRMNVAEKRKPQDGRLKTRTPAGMETELRLSTLPTAFGEKMVMRIFDPEILVRSYEQLGLTGSDLTTWQKLSSSANGILLVTGPTGSGKTTTLYSSLKQLAKDSVNVCTIEDPIEMVEPSFNQMQVQTNIGLTFAEGIRALMRQDPDIIMIGEIRDPETAEMAIQAALTGHLVISTLHTNDAPSALTRLHDLGVQPFLTASTILGVMAQRLARTLCPHCKKAVPTDEKVWHDLVSPWKAKAPKVLYEPVGCEQCRYTGYKGRVGLYELLTMSNDLKRLVSDQSSLNIFKQQAFQEGLEPLRIAGARKIAEGITSMDEVMRVVPLS